MKIGSIVVRCYEFDKMLAFWQEALHYIPREPAKNGWVVLRDPEGRGPNLSLVPPLPPFYLVFEFLNHAEGKPEGFKETRRD